MDKKVAKVFVCFLLIFIFAFCTLGANAKTIESNNFLTDTEINIIKPYLNKLSFNDNYIVYKENNVINLYIGDFKYIDNSFTCNTDFKLYSFTNNLDNSFDFSLSVKNSLDFNVNDFYVFSDLGDYPNLIERSVNYEILITIILCIFMLFYIIRQFFR